MSMITVSVHLPMPAAQVWDLFTQPSHVINWNFASPDWCCPQAEAELKPGGRYVYRMEAKDGSFGFDLGATYSLFEPPFRSEAHLDDNRLVQVTLESDHQGTWLKQSFQPENIHPEEFQRQGWQAILDSFKAYATSQFNQ